MKRIIDSRNSLVKRNYYLLIAADVDKRRLSEPSAYTVIKHLFEIRKWGLKASTRNRCQIAPGDKVLAYASGNREMGGHIVGEAVVSSPARPIQRNSDSPTVNFAVQSEYCLSLEGCRLFDHPVFLRSESVKRSLKFIKKPDSKKWGNCLQNGSLKISYQDFEQIKAMSTSEA